MSIYDTYPSNPNFGSGCYRRRIRLCAQVDRVIGELEDDNHGFRVDIRHQHGKIVEVQGEALRVPYTTCAGAVAPLRRLQGLFIGEAVDAVHAQSDPRSQCTHLYDLSLWALARAAEGPGEDIYDITVDDEHPTEGGYAEICVNGARLHRWLVRDWQLVTPEPLAGNTLYKGFSAWAAKAFSGRDLQAAQMLQKGCFVGSARRFNLSALAGESATTAEDVMAGACFTHRSPQIEVAVRTSGTIRDFSTAPEQLLQFKGVE